MFTGIIEELGTVLALESRVAGARLRVTCGLVLSDLTEGASVAVNGVCLTAVGITWIRFVADHGAGDFARDRIWEVCWPGRG